ncbi:MAG: sulfotransferase [Spongiibacteraceae bacterium]
MQTQALIAVAQQLTGGLTNLGDDSILGPLNILVDSLNKEAKLNARGEKSVEGMLIGTLANRLRVEDYLSKHPELLQRPVEKPMFVFGLPRTGTTLVINLLSVDPARRSFLRWEAFDSVPPPKKEELHAGPRYDKAKAQLDMALKMAPHISAIHHEDADSPTECQFSMNASFCAEVYDSQFDIPSYHQWLMHDADYLPAFRYQKRLLQLLQAETGGRWTLKNPWHPLFLDALTTVYPDAQLVMTHRDPVDVVGSACSLLKAVRPMFSDDVNLKAIGEVLLDTFDIMIERTLAYKAKHGWDSIYDLQYADVMKDPIGAIKNVYKHFDEPFTKEAETAMNAFMASNQQGKHGKHTYSLADYSLTKEQIRERYKDYCDRFGIATKD